ncbi:hypothetical protein B0H10DRAFT_1788717 [Mycena sp. CBHHK59/15]|nr:hypothetical protein B0H10DRAFT_1788717 [Mycena sp. CBHHK59/15]
MDLFPPTPSTKQDQHRTISGMCTAVDPANFEEAGCAVCGQLIALSELTPQNTLTLDYLVLIEHGVTRKECNNN